MLSPTQHSSFNSPMPRTMMVPSLPSSPRSLMGATPRSGISQPFSSRVSVHSYPATAVSYQASVEDVNHYYRRELWNGTHAKNVARAPAWSRYGREDALNPNLEMHPFWVAKAPGTFDATKERWNLRNVTPATQSLARPITQAGWDSRFPVAHCLDGNPVHNGHRMLSPARRRHNGGVGAEGLV